MVKNILVSDPNKTEGRYLQRILEEEGYDVSLTSSFRESIPFLVARTYDLLLIRESQILLPASQSDPEVQKALVQTMTSGQPTGTDLPDTIREDYLRKFWGDGRQLQERVTGIMELTPKIFLIYDHPFFELFEENYAGSEVLKNAIGQLPDKDTLLRLVRKYTKQ